MAAYSGETQIQAPPSQVFAYVSDLTKHAEWAQHGLQVRQTSAGRPGMGATFESTAKQFGTQRETQTVTEYSPPSRFAFEAKGKLGLARHAFDLSPSDGGTRVSKTMEITQPSLMAKITAPMIASQTKKGLGVDLERIKARLEGGQQPASDPAAGAASDTTGIQ
jgi:uncharacterized protein YndB with AHSA1/START domain